MNAKLVRLASVVAILLWLGWALNHPVFAAASFTVDDIGDEGDASWGDGFCATSSGTCTLRAAIEELNDQGPGGTPHLIRFGISGSTSFTITPGSPLPAITVPVFVDGTTQPGSTCPTNQQSANLLIILDGVNAGSNEDGLTLDTGSDGSTLQGLVIGNFDGDGIRLNSNENKVRCNHIGVNIDGISPMGNNTTGIFVAGTENMIGGPNSHAARNVISANSRPIQLYGSLNSVANNFIGTTADGMFELGNSSGIVIALDGNIIGGTASLSRNIISSSGGYAIYISQTDDTQILGNLIGVARDGLTPLPNGGDGIIIFGNADNNVIGGTSAGAGNIIAYNAGTGIELSPNGINIPMQNEIRGNAIYENGTLGIELQGDSNGGQNYPTLVSTPDSYIVAATLSSAPGTLYAVDVYKSQACDPSGFGEGRNHLGSWQMLTDGSGQIAFDLDLTGIAANGNVITATATDPNGNSSEFSNCVALEIPYKLYLPIILQ